MVESLLTERDRDLLIGQLDDARRKYEHARHQRVETVLYARSQGMSFHHIGIALNMTENGVRSLVKRAAA